MTALLFALLASPAFACAVCGAGEDDPSRGSYVWMTMVISLLPLAMLGGIVGYVVLKTRAAETRDETQTADSAPKA